MKSLFKELLIYILISNVFALNTSCDLLKTKYGYVCKCTAEYCDYLEEPQLKNANTFIAVTSSKSGLRFHVTDGEFNNEGIVKIKDYMELDENVLKNEDYKTMTIAMDTSKTFFQIFDKDNFFFARNPTSPIAVNVNRTETYQKIEGFGGAFTGSVSYILEKLEPHLQDQIYKTYFHKDGIQYNMLRLSIGGCDFDLSPWAYNELPEYDKELTNFTRLDERDLMKIQQIERLKQVALIDNIRIMAAAWSPPPWMKTNNAWTGYSSLKREYYQTWANYHLKFLELMNAKNMPIWAISTGNEPLNGVIGWFFVHFMSLGWTPRNQAIYLSEYLGPTIRNSPFKNVLIFGNDDQRYTFPAWFREMNSTRFTCLDYLDGLAVHWYWDNVFGPELIDLTLKFIPNRLLFNTEACVGDKPWQTHGPELGSWSRAEQYAKALLQDFHHNFNGWLDWNLLLDDQGGPNYVRNYVDAPIIVNTQNFQEFYKQPIFYILGHLSKFLPSQSMRIATQISVYRISIDAVAFKRPDDKIILILFNSASIPQDICVHDSERGSFVINVPAHSIHTILYV
ncbi:lysosomal acid glucosylceramidase [Glossina fuscipes]|uniref:Glucosylceramidase n=1 Tax=Glossina fuscipes TaxID=7396 RepID=A0A8U0WJS8_9MUSC|nr:lysosomal acid glucosylceramidase [Glossina fuscipes]